MRIERTDQRFIAKSSVLLVPYMLHRNCLGGAIPSMGEEEVVGVHGRLGWQREDLSGGGQHGSRRAKSLGRGRETTVVRMARPLRQSGVSVLLAPRGKWLGSTVQSLLRQDNNKVR